MKDRGGAMPPTRVNKEGAPSVYRCVDEDGKRWCSIRWALYAPDRFSKAPFGGAPPRHVQTCHRRKIFCCWKWSGTVGNWEFSGVVSNGREWSGILGNREFLGGRRPSSPPFQGSLRCSSQWKCLLHRAHLWHDFFFVYLQYYGVTLSHLGLWSPDWVVHKTGSKNAGKTQEGKAKKMLTESHPHLEKHCKTMMHLAEGGTNSVRNVQGTTNGMGPFLPFVTPCWAI